MIILYLILIFVFWCFLDDILRKSPIQKISIFWVRKFPYSPYYFLVNLGKKISQKISNKISPKFNIFEVYKKIINLRLSKNKIDEFRNFSLGVFFVIIILSFLFSLLTIFIF